MRDVLSGQTGTIFGLSPTNERPDSIGFNRVRIVVVVSCRCFLLLAMTWILPAVRVTHFE